MKRITRITLLFIILGILFSCDYDTHVLNIVHRDGSVTRRITVENSSNYWEPGHFYVPIDSTWNTEVSFKINGNKDTVWYLTAEKHFDNVEQINELYKNDLGLNRNMERRASFSKKFRWFTTEFRYSERVESALNIDCPLSDFVTDEELRYINLPVKVQDDLKNNADSTKYRNMDNGLEDKLINWLYSALVRQWIDIFQDLYGNNPSLQINREGMLAREFQFVDYMKHDSIIEEDLDDSILPDSMFIAVLGDDFYQGFQKETSYTNSLLEEMVRPAWDCHDYTIEMQMPGNIVATNGYTETETAAETDTDSRGILFTLSFDRFMTQDYECWVESRVNNYFIWAVTGLFVLAVVLGLFRRYLFS